MQHDILIEMPRFMPALTKQTLQDFLLKGNIAKIATIDENELPYISPVWYEWDGKSFYVIARAKSRFLANIRKNNNVAVFIDIGAKLHTRVTVQGKTGILPDFDWIPVGRRMTLRCLGESGLASYLDGTLDSERVVIRVDPTLLQSWTGMDWHPHYTS